MIGKRREARRGREAGEGECRLGNREGRAYLVVVGQLFIGFHHLGGAKVDAAQHDVVLTAGLDVTLQRWLSVQFNGEVDDVAAL